MSELGETFRGMREVSKARRAANRLHSTKILFDAGIEFENKNHGAHLVIGHDGHTIDFWPGTGRWKYRDSRDAMSGRGIRNLLRRMGVIDT